MHKSLKPAVSSASRKVLYQDFGLPPQVAPLGIPKKHKCFFVFLLKSMMTFLCVT